MNIPRIVNTDPKDQIIAMAMMLYSMPVPENLDALVVMPGECETWRLTEMVDYSRDHANFRHFIVAGDNEGITPELMERFGDRCPSNAIIQPKAAHTKAQTDWIVEQFNEHDVMSARLFVSPYHQLRAYCTLLKSMLNTDKTRIPIFPARMLISPFTHVPKSGVPTWDLVPGEVARILAYQEKGDVASYNEFLEYMKFLWESL